MLYVIGDTFLKTNKILLISMIPAQHLTTGCRRPLPVLIHNDAHGQMHLLLVCGGMKSLLSLPPSYLSLLFTTVAPFPSPTVSNSLQQSPTAHRTCRAICLLTDVQIGFVLLTHRRAGWGGSPRSCCLGVGQQDEDHAIARSRFSVSQNRGVGRAPWAFLRRFTFIIGPGLEQLRLHCSS